MDRIFRKDKFKLMYIPRTGFSIMETVVCMAVLCIILLLLFGIIPSSIRAMNKASYYQFASSQAMRLIESASESELPDELKTSLKFPLYNTVKDVFKGKVVAKPLSFTYFGEQQMNPGIVVFKNDKRNVNFIYLVTYRNVETEISSEYMLADIMVDMWWSEKMNDLNLNHSNIDPAVLSHISYIKRIYIRGKNFDVGK